MLSESSANPFAIYIISRPFFSLPILTPFIFALRLLINPVFKRLKYLHTSLLSGPNQSAWKTQQPVRVLNVCSHPFLRLFSNPMPKAKTLSSRRRISSSARLKKISKQHPDLALPPHPHPYPHLHALPRRRKPPASTAKEPPSRTFQHSLFARLPLEIRLTIYERVIGKRLIHIYRAAQPQELQTIQAAQIPWLNSVLCRQSAVDSPSLCVAEVGFAFGRCFDVSVEEHRVRMRRWGLRLRERGEWKEGMGNGNGNGDGKEKWRGKGVRARTVPVTGFILPLLLTCRDMYVTNMPSKSHPALPCLPSKHQKPTNGTKLPKSDNPPATPKPSP